MKTLLALLVLVTATPAAKAGYYCAPYVTHTCVLSRTIECRWATDHCGYRFQYEVQVIVIRNYLSDGTCETFRRTVRL